MNIRRDWPEYGFAGRSFMLFCYLLALPFAIVGLVIGWCAGSFISALKSGIEEAEEA